MATHSHRITITGSKQSVFEAITTPKGLQGWYTPSVEGSAADGDKLKLHFTSKDGPFHWNITEVDAGSSVKWECLAGPGSSPGTVATFTLIDSGDGRTIVDFDHEGLDESDEKLRVCNTMWGALMLHLQKYVESNEPNPAFC